MTDKLISVWFFAKLAAKANFMGRTCLALKSSQFVFRHREIETRSCCMFMCAGWRQVFEQSRAGSIDDFIHVGNCEYPPHHYSLTIHP